MEKCIKYCILLQAHNMKKSSRKLNFNYANICYLYSVLFSFHLPNLHNIIQCPLVLQTNEQNKEQDYRNTKHWTIYEIITVHVAIYKQAVM